MSVSFTPPPPAAVTGGGSFIAQLQPPPDADDTPSPYFSSASATSSPSSVITVMIIITSSVIVSASIYLLLRILSKRSSSAVDDVVLQSEAQKCQVAFNGTLLESLPLFSFRSITGNLSGGGDCAVCLSKFEPHDELRLLPLCCHAFHAECIDTWIVSNQTCPLCRSTVLPSGADALNKILSADNHRTSNTNIDSSRNENASGNENGGSFRIEIGSISRRLGGEIEAVEGARRHSYSVGSFEYVVDDNAYEVSVGCTTHHHRRGISNCTSNVKESSVGVPTPEPPGEVLAAEVAGSRNWLKDYVDRLSSAVSISSRATSFRSSGRFFSGSSRRSEAVVVPEDLEANRAGEEISELFRWLSGI